MSKQTSDSSQSRFAGIRRHVKRYRGYLYAGAFAVLFANGLQLVNPYITKLIFDGLENGSPMDHIGTLALAMLGVAILSGGFRFMMRRTIIWMSRKLEYDLRSDLMTHLLKLSPSFYDRTRTGDIMARATNDLEAVRMMLGPAIMHLANTFVVATGAIAMMVYLSPRLTLYALVPAILLPFTMHRLGTLIHRKFAKIQEHFSKLNAMVQENLAGVRVVKAYQQESAESAAFSDMSQDYLTLNMDMGRYQAFFMPIIQLIVGVLALVVIYFGGYDVMSGTIPLSTIIAFFMYVGMLTWPLMAIGWVVSLYQRGTASLDRINTILNTEPDIVADPPSESPVQLEGELEFRNLTFAYENSKPVLHDISLHLRPGETLGVVGPTGCGKTSLVSLVAGLYPVTRGQLLIDGKDINDWNLSDLRAQVGFATQEPFLFSATIQDNIRFGSPLAEIDAIKDVARTAAIAKDVEEFPESYETIVGERGITLSGGQKQRTAIARAALVDPAILILDDATSSVDTETEFEMNQRIRERTRKLTTLIVSHRISSVQNADEIVYLEEGRIVERGNHDQLIAADGPYAELYRLQLLQEEIENL